jgi:hypothetical protein
MADKISEIYAKARKKGVLTNGLTEDMFREQTKTDEGLRSFYDIATANGMKFHPFEEFKGRFYGTSMPNDAKEQDNTQSAATSLADNAITAAKEPVAKPVDIPTKVNNPNLLTPIEAERAGQDNLHNKINKSWGTQIFEKPTTDMEAAMTMAGEQKTPEDLLETFAQAWSEHSDEGKAMLKNMEDVYNDTQNAYLQQFQQTQEYANLVSKLQKEVNAKKLTPEQAGEELSKLFVAQYGNKLEKDKQNLYSDYLKEAQAALEQSPYQKDWNAVNAHIATDQNKDLNSRIDSELEKRTNEIKQQKQSAPKSPLKLARDIMADRKGDVEVAKATKDLQAAKAFATQAEDMITSVRESKNFFADFGKSFGKTITSNDTWDFGVGQLMNSIALKNAADKADKGEPLTHDEELLLEAAANYMAVSMYYSDKVGRGTKAGQTTAASIPFMLEFMLTSGAGAAMTNATTRGITRFAIRMLGNGARKKGVRIGAEVAGKTLSDIGYAELLTNTLSAPRIAEGTISRMNGSVKPQLNDSKDGFRYDGRTGQQELGEALWNAHSDQFIENYSEVVFGALDPLKDPAKAAIKSSKLLGKMAAGVESNAVTGTLIRAWNNPTAVALRKETRFGGLFEETMEEEVGGLFRLVANTDVNDAKDAGLDIDSQIDIILGLAPSVLLMNGAGATFHYSKQARDVRKMREYLKTDEERQMFDRVMSESRSGEFGREAHDFIREIVMNNDIPNEAKRQIILQTVDKYKDVLSNDLVQQAQQIKRQDRTARRETAIRERLGHQTNESDGKVYRASIAGNDTENNFIKKGTIVLNEDGTIDKSQSDGYFVVAVTDNDGNTQIKQVPVSAITNIEGGEAAEDMAQAEIEYYNTLDQAHEMFPEGSIVTIPNSNGAVSEVHYDERGNILVDVEGGQQVKFTPQEAIDKLVPIHEETPQQPQVDGNPTPQPAPVPQEENPEPTQGEIVTFNIAGADVPFEKEGDQYYMLDADNQRTGRPFSLQDLQEKGAQPIVAETPQQGEQVEEANLNDQNLFYHLDYGDHFSAFDHSSGAYIKDGVLYPGTAKDNQQSYIWWNEGKPYSMGVNGKPYTRLITAPRGDKFLQVRSLSTPIGQWNGKSGFVTKREYVTKEIPMDGLKVYTLRNGKFVLDKPISSVTPIEKQQDEQVDITNPKPIGTNKFGNVYQWVTGKAKEAAQFLRQHKNSYLKGVFHRDDIGDIDLVWGNDKAGLQHIVKRHILEQTDFDSISEAIEAIGETIQNGKIDTTKPDFIVIDNGKYRVVLAKSENGNWVLTAYDNSKPREEKQKNASSTTSQVLPSKEQDNLSDVGVSHQSDTQSDDKNTENNSNTQENGEEKVSDVAEDNTQAARKRGFRMENGHRIDRQQPIENKAEGRETNIAFGSETKDQVPARYTLIDASELQPSHRNGVRNRAFFIDETQPKERTDQVSVVKAQQMAQQIRPGEITRGESAYMGAPIVNSRGEVVQGNNRSAALREMYDGFPDSVEAYKQFLRENAAEFGLTAEDTDKIQNPVLVRMTDIADEEAIRLGNMTAADTESGGVQRIPAKETARKLGDKLGRFIEILTSTEDEEATINSTIKGNAVKALEYLHKNGIINDTQYQSAFNNGSPAADTIADLAAIVTDMLFADSKYGEIRTMYETLPGAIKLALADVMYRDMQSPDGGHIKEYVQEAIAVYYAAQHSSSEFEKIKTGSSAEYAERAMFAAKNQTNIDGTPAISKRFSNFAIKLATLFAYKKRKELRNLFNHFFDDVQGANGDMFSPAEKKPFEQAVKDNFNVSINDGRQSNDSTPLQGTGGSSPQRGRERNGKPQSGQQGKGGEQRSDDTPSGTPIQGEPENSAGGNRAAGDPVEPQQQNKIFTEDAYEAARRRMHERLNRLNAGLDPEMLSDGLIMAGYHVEKGARKFAEFAREMIREFGDKIRPYLKSFYNGLRDLPEAVELSKEMDDYGTVAQFDVNSISINDTLSQEQNNPERKFANAVSRLLLDALDSNETQTPFRTILDLRKLAKENGMDVDDNGKTDILLQELVEDGLVRAARQLVASGKYGDAKSKATYDAIVHLYEIQPTIAQRSSNRIAMQQYSTPLPMAFVADMFAYEPNMRSILEPTAGNGMLVFAVPAEKVHANELDETRLANLHLQEFQEVTSQDATEPFGGGKRYDAIIANPPFGSREEREYDGKMIAGLDPQITLNALASMKDNGKAAIIIGGNMEYADNGSVKDKKAFWSYLYDHYNVKGVVDMDGQLYRKQGTTYPTRMILIDGRRSEAEREQTTIYPPIQQKAIAKVNTFDDLYNTIAEITNSNKKTNGTEILRTAGGSSSVSDSNNTSGNIGVLGHSGKHSADDGNGRDGGQRPTDSTGSAGGNRPNDEGGVSPTSGASGRKVSGHSMGGVLRPQEPVHGLNTTSDDGSSARPERATTDGERSGEDNVGRLGRVPVDGIRELGTPGDRVGLKSQPKRNLTEEKLPYRSHNTAFSLQSVAPAAMVEAMDNTLSQIEKSVGKSIDQFITDELGYDTIQDAHNALAAEQMDSVAMAIYQMKQGQSLIIGDQTGVGKGRQMAALIRWAVRQGKKPIFITQKADLFSDIYRDLVDIGSGDLRPFIFNSATAKDGKGIVVDANGNEIYKALSDEKTKLICLQSNELPDGFDYVLATYSQFNSGDNVSRKAGIKKKKKLDEDKVAKATFLRKLSRDNYLFLDESHTAAGESNTGTFFQSIIGAKGEDGVRAVTFASATFAKRPDTMPMYALRTAMAEANVEREKLIGIIEKGGVTLQEIMSRALTESGQMVRRERDMTDVKTDWKTIDDPATTKRAREQYDRTIVAFNAIIDFQDKFITPLVKEQDRELAEVMSTANLKKGTKKFGVDNTPFASKTFNYTKQLMLALKVDAIVDEVEREIKAGRHPVIALESTMESTIKDYTPGEIIAEPSFSASLLKGLDNCMQYTIKDDQGVETHMTYTPNELGEEGETAYYKLQDFIRESTKDIFISPLDAIIERLHEKGYRVGELTGRNTYVERTDDGKIVVRRRTDKDKKRMQREFNSGALDVLILNKSASTGISLHASEKFSDKRQRSMIIAQPLSDINDYMQMIGRIDRTGQVHRGYYINLGLPVPAESRFLMMLSTKLKSLNANTTTSQDSESNEVDAPDLLNKYGSQVVIEYLRDNPTIYEKIGEPLKKNSKKGDDKIIHANELDEYTPSEDDALKITGRVALLNTKEQEEFYNDVVRRYNDLIRYLNDTGTNDLKITILPLRAKTISRKVSSVGREPNGNNPFAGNAYVEQVEMDVLRKPMKANEVQKLIVQLNGTSDRAAGRKRVKDIMSIVERETEDKMTLENERYENAKQKAALTLEEYARKINANEKMSSEQKATTIEQKQQETEQKLADKNRDNILSIQHKAAYLNRMLDMFTVGETYLVPDDLGSAMFSSSTHSIFCGYKVKDNKISASTSFAVFATLDGRRKVEIKLSDISILNRINDHTNQNWDAAQQTTLDNWDKQIPTQTRKEGYIMTGNILQAVADTQDEYGNYTGQLISYTDIDGNIHDGILMPDKWKTSQLRGGVPISARLEQMKQGTVVSTDGKVTIRRGWGAPDVYFLIVPKSKSEGGKYFLNPDILRLVEGNNFYTVRGHMQAEVPAQNIEAVLGILSDMGVKAQDSTIEAQYDELDYTPDNLTDAQQLATDAVLGALDDAGIFVERVSEEEAEREVEKEKSESSVRLIRQMAEGTKGQSNNPITSAKVQKNLEDAKEKYKKYGISTENAITDISKALGARNTGTSNYITIEAKNGTIFTLRLSNHNATVANFDNNGETSGISIVISRHDNKGITNNGDAHIVEFFYSDKSLNKADGTPIADIIGALEQTMYSGEYTDPTGLAQRQEVNIPTEPLRTSNGTIYGYAKDGKIYLTDRGLNPNTPIHEYTHLWAKAMQAKNLQGWQSVVGLLKGTPMWDEVANDPHYSHLTDDNAVASEVLSRYSGSRGAQLFEQKSKSVLEQNPSISAFARVRVLLNNVREALNKFWNWVGKDLFHIDHFDSIEEVADRILYDLTNGTDLSTGIKDGVAEMQIAPLPKKEGESIAEYAKRMVDYQNSFAVDQAAQKAQFEYEKHINEQHSALRKLEKGVTDFAKPIMSFQEYMVKQGAIMDIDSDTYQDIWRAGSRTQTAINKYHRECEEPLANTVKSIVNSQKLDNLGFVWQNLPYDALKKNKDQMNNTTITPRRVVGLYLQAKDCEEALQLGLVDRGAAGFEQNVCLPNVEGYEHGVPYTKIIEMVEDALGKDMVDILWKRVRAAVDYGLDYQIKRGMISEETRNKYKREFYVPQRGWEERDMSGLATDYQRAGGALYGSPYNSALKQAKGRTSLAADPFAYITSIAYSSITSADDNVTRQHLLKFCLDNEELGLQSGAFRIKKFWVVREIDADGNIIGEPTISYAQPTERMYEHDKEINAKLGTIRKQLGELNRLESQWQSVVEIENINDVVREAVNKKLLGIREEKANLEKEAEALSSQLCVLNSRSTDGFNLQLSEDEIGDLTKLDQDTHRTKAELNQHVIYVEHNGQKYALLFKNEQIPNALNKTYKSSLMEIPLISEAARKATRLISATLTQYNPEFAARNYIKDRQTAITTLSVEQGAKFTAKFEANLNSPLLNAAVMQYAFNDNVRDRGKVSGKYKDLLNEYFEHGAQTGYSFLPDLQRVRKDFDKLLKNNNAKEFGKATINMLSVLTEASETSIRFAAYVTARESGMSADAAASLSKELTTNFNRHGEWSNSALMSLYSFMRATINGNLKYLRGFKKFPIGFSIAAAAYYAAGVLCSLLNPNDPDNDIWFTDYVRETNITLGKFLGITAKIPLGHFMVMFYAAGVNTVAGVRGNKSAGEAVFDTMQMASNELLPSWMNFMAGATYDTNTGMGFDATQFAQSAAPSVVSPFVDVWLNRNFMGGRISNEYDWNKDEKDILKYNSGTSQFYIDIANGLYEAVGGDLKVKNKLDDNTIQKLVDVSPSATEHIVEGYSPAIAETILQTAAVIQSAAKGADIAADELPFVRKFYSSYHPERAAAQQYYMLKSRSKDYSDLLKEYQKKDRNKYNSEKAKGKVDLNERTQRALKRIKLDSPSNADIKTLMELNREWNKID